MGVGQAGTRRRRELGSQGINEPSTGLWSQTDIDGDDCRMKRRVEGVSGQSGKRKDRNTK